MVPRTRTPPSTLACASAADAADGLDRAQRRQGRVRKRVTAGAAVGRPPVPADRSGAAARPRTSAATLRTAASACCASGRAAAIRTGSGPVHLRRTRPAARPRSLWPSRSERNHGRRPGPAIAVALRRRGSLAPVGAASPTGRRRREGGGIGPRESDQRLSPHARRYPCRPRPAREPGRPRRRRARRAVVAACT